MTDRAALRHYEDFAEGETADLGERTVAREEVIAFARAFDPQPMHLDEAAARASLLGGLAASGWHSCAMLMRMICDGFLCGTASLGSPGLEEVKWLKPVKVGDRIRASYRIASMRRSRSRPGMGICRFLYEVRNQDGAVVMTWDCTHLIATRSEAAP